MRLIKTARTEPLCKPENLPEMVPELEGGVWKAQGVLQRSTGKLSGELQFIKISEEIQGILDACPKNYDTRNIYLFLFLNGDASFLDDLAEDNNFAHLIDTVPRFPQELMLKVILSTGGLRFIRELITFSPHVVSISVLETILSCAELHPSKFQDIFVASELSKACYHRLRLGYAKPAIESQIFFDFFKQLQADSFRYQFKGKDKSSLESHTKAIDLLHHMNVVSLICEGNRSDTTSCWDGYEMSVQKSFGDYTINHSKPVKIPEILIECQKLTVSLFEMVAKQISVADFVDWAELSISQSETYQQAIIKVAREVRVKLEEIGDIEDNCALLSLRPFVETLSHLVREPEDEDIEDASIDKIKEMLSGEEHNNKDWMKALLKKVNVVNDASAIEIIRNNCTLLDKEDVKFILAQILNIHTDEAKKLSELEKLQCLAYEMTKELPMEDLKQVLKARFDQFCHLSEISYSDFASCLKKAFDNTHFNSEDCELKWQCEILRLSILNPNAVAKKCFKVWIQNMQTTDLMISVLKVLQPFSKSAISAWITEISKKCPFDNLEMNNFPKLIMELVENELLEKEVFIKVYVFSALEKNIESEDWSVINMWLTTMGRVMHDITLFEKECGSNAVIVLYLGQVLEFCQKSIADYSKICVMARIKTLEMLENLQCFKISEHERLWLYSHIGNDFSTLTKCHLKPFGACESVSLVTRKYEDCIPAEGITPEVAGYILAEIMPFFTILEWKGLTDVLQQRFGTHDDPGYSIFKSYSQALIILLAACSEVNFEISPKPVNCIIHGLTCLGDILANVVFPSVKILNCLPVLEETIYLMSKLPIQVWDGYIMNLLPDLVRFMGRVHFDLEARKRLSFLILTCPAHPSRDILLRETNQLSDIAATDLCLGNEGKVLSHPV